MKQHRNISIADQIFEQLERDILSGKYPRGEQMSELRLSAELGVSRTPVREAIRRLEQEDILEESDAGMVVVGISQDDLMDMYEIRMSVETQSARRAAERITEAELKEMREIVDLQRFYAEKGGPDASERIRELDSEFHRLLYRSSGSRTFYHVLSALHKKIAKYRTASISKRGRAARSIEEHEAIWQALAAHDGDAAFEAAAQHLKHARDSMAGMEL